MFGTVVRPCDSDENHVLRSDLGACSWMLASMYVANLI